jgi:hypothetical protein
MLPFTHPAEQEYRFAFENIALSASIKQDIDPYAGGEDMKLDNWVMTIGIGNVFEHRNSRQGTVVD